MGWCGPIRQPGPGRRHHQGQPPPGASRTAKNGTGQGVRPIKSDEQSRRPGNGTKRAQIGKASGFAHR